MEDLRELHLRRLQSGLDGTACEITRVRVQPSSRTTEAGPPAINAGRWRNSVIVCAREIPSRLDTSILETRLKTGRPGTTPTLRR